MSWNKKIFIFIIVSLSILFADVVSAYALNVHIIDYSYSTHFMPGETVTFGTRVQNNETSAKTLYVNIVLTKKSTGQEVAPYPAVTSFSLAAGSSTWVTTNLNNWTAAEGLYTVTIILYDATDTEQHRVYGSEPVHVGQAKDYVSVFPNIIDLGVLPYGRYMLPNPIKIHWSFYLRNNIRRDQPWYMRIYTDNAGRYKGIDEAIYKSRRVYTTSKIKPASGAEGSPAGLVSSDGRYTIPLKVWCLNFGPDWDEIGWNPTLLGPPPVNDDYVWKGPQLDDGKRDTDRGVWLWIPDYIDMTLDSRTWRNLIGQDPYNRNYISDNNPTGDFTLDSPFDIYLATETSPATVVGKYGGKLIIEIYTP